MERRTAKERSDAGLGTKVASAIECLLREDSELLARDVNEKTITGQLAGHMRPLFPELDFHCEFNRNGHEIKRADGKIVCPDIIVHLFGTCQNFLRVLTSCRHHRFRDILAL